MPKNKPLPTSEPESIELAWNARDEKAMLRALVKKYARVLDMTDSGRDVKPLATGMLEAMSLLKNLEASEGITNGDTPTPLAEILNKAD